MKLIENYLIKLNEQKIKKKEFTKKEAKIAGDEIGVDWSKYSVDNFLIGMNIELEHGTINSQTNITDDDPIMTGKIAYIHMKEIPGTGNNNDYYSLLKKYVESNEKE